VDGLPALAGITLSDVAAAIVVDFEPGLNWRSILDLAVWDCHTDFVITNGIPCPVAPGFPLHNFI